MERVMDCPRIIVFTDLDSTLLDRATYSWHEAAESLEALRGRQAHVVLVSSKTFAEMEALHKAIGFDDPFIVENGGAIAVRAATPVAERLAASPAELPCVSTRSHVVIPLGKPYEEITRHLRQISSETGLELVGFASMSEERISELTGLSPEEAANAKRRDFSEPFLVSTASAAKEEAVRTAAERRGLAVVQGGRFRHLMGHQGKGPAVWQVIEAYRSLYGRVLTVGLGDSPNDFPFLELMDIPVLVAPAPKPAPPALLARSRQTIEPGPKGWNGAVLQILSEQQEECNERFSAERPDQHPAPVG